MKIQASRTLLAIALGLTLACGSALAQTNAAQSERAAATPSARTNAPDAAFVEKASAAGLVFSCTGLISLKVRINYGGSIYANQEFILQKL